MKILDRYIGITVIASTMIALAVLVSLDMFIAFLAELDDIGKGKYSLGSAMFYILLTIPRRIYLLFPMAALLGSIIGLGILASNSELTVIRAAGVSLSRIVISVMKSALLLMVAVILIGEYVIPYSEQYAKSRRSMAMTDQITLKTKYGFWARDANSYINIRNILPGGVVGDIYLYEFDDKHRMHTTTYARQASYSDDRWILKDIVQSRISDTKVSRRSIERAEWDSLLSPELLNVVVVNPENLSMVDLRRYINYLHANGQTADRYELAFWVKTSAPIAIGVMIFLAVPFVFGPLRSVGLGQRILVGVLFGIAFHILNQTFNHLGLAYDFSPFLSAFLPSMLFLAVAMVLARRV